jgi:hypothetical protein
MPVCIYCVMDKPASAFTKTEHVLPQAFGRFTNNLTLNDTVCDDCNEFFGNTIDLYLARDTPDGFNRFVLGYRPPDKYKSLGKASTMTHRLTEGPWAGAFVEQSPDEGELGVKFLPQVGFGPSPTGPFKWFLVTDLPTKKQLRELFETGHRHLHFPSMQDEAAKDAVVKELVSRGLKYEDAELPPELSIVGKMPKQRIEAKAIIAEKFGRALAKIGLNYLAHQCGARIALMAQFSTVRECVRREITLPPGSWRSEGVLREGAKPGHVLILTWDPAGVVVRIAFHSWIIYPVVLAQGGFIIQPPIQARGHFYNLSTMTVEPYRL